MLPHPTYRRTHRTVAPLKQISAKLQIVRARDPGAVLAPVLAALAVRGGTLGVKKSNVCYSVVLGSQMCITWP